MKAAYLRYAAFLVLVQAQRFFTEVNHDIFLLSVVFKDTLWVSRPIPDCL